MYQGDTVTADPVTRDKQRISVHSPLCLTASVITGITTEHTIKVRMYTVLRLLSSAVLNPSRVFARNLP